MIRSARQRAIALLARRWPQALYHAIGLLARASGPVIGQTERVRRLRAVFPHLSEAEAERVARELRCSTLKSRALGVGLARTRGEPVYPPVHVDPAFATVQAPAILTTFHVGPLSALGEAVRRMPGEIAALHRMDWRLPSNVAGIYVDGTDAGGSAAFYRAIQTLRRGGCVVILADGPPGHDVSLLGRVATLKRGPYALARITGAPLMPLLTHWNGAAVEIACGPTIEAVDDERVMAQAMAGVLERHLLAHPAEIGDHLLGQLSHASCPAPSRATP